MISPPCYYPISQEGMYEWYRILTESLDAGIMIYDQSWRQDIGTSLGVELIGQLAELPGIVSLKYGAPNIIEPMVEALDRFAERFAFIDNSLGYTSTLAYMHGAAGFISGPSTWWPEFELEFFRLLEAGDFAGADRWHAKIGPYMWLHQSEGGPGWRGPAGRGHHQGGAGLRGPPRRTVTTAVPRRERGGTARDSRGAGRPGRAAGGACLAATPGRSALLRGDAHVFGRVAQDGGSDGDLLDERARRHGGTEEDGGPPRPRRRSWLRGPRPSADAGAPRAAACRPRRAESCRRGCPGCGIRRSRCP